MSDQAQGPGWWQASDGKWYPPEQRPARPEPETRAATGPGPDQGGPGMQQAGAQGPWPQPGPGYQRPAGEKGFFASLYDPSFDTFVTPRLLRVFYMIVLVVLTVGAVLVLISGLASGEAGGILAALIIVPIGYFLYLIFARIYFELVAALFRIADDLRAIRRDRGL
jgi:hypothetical protein